MAAVMEQENRVMDEAAAPAAGSAAPVAFSEHPQINKMANAVYRSMQGMQQGITVNVFVMPYPVSPAVQQAMPGAPQGQMMWRQMSNDLTNAAQMSMTPQARAAGMQVPHAPAPTPEQAADFSSLQGIINYIEQSLMQWFDQIFGVRDRQVADSRQVPLDGEPEMVPMVEPRRMGGLVNANIVQPVADRNRLNEQLQDISDMVKTPDVPLDLKQDVLERMFAVAPKAGDASVKEAAAAIVDHPERVDQHLRAVGEAVIQEAAAPEPDSVRSREAASYGIGSERIFVNDKLAFIKENRQALKEELKALEPVAGQAKEATEKAQAKEAPQAEAKESPLARVREAGAAAEEAPQRTDEERLKEMGIEIPQFDEEELDRWEPTQEEADRMVSDEELERFAREAGIEPEIEPEIDAAASNDAHSINDVEVDEPEIDAAYAALEREIDEENAAKRRGALQEPDPMEGVKVDEPENLKRAGDFFRAQAPKEMSDEEMYRELGMEQPKPEQNAPRKQEPPEGLQQVQSGGAPKQNVQGQRKQDAQRQRKQDAQGQRKQDPNAPERRGPAKTEAEKVRERIEQRRARNREKNQLVSNGMNKMKKDGQKLKEDALKNKDRIEKFKEKRARMYEEQKKQRQPGMQRDPMKRP